MDMGTGMWTTERARTTPVERGCVWCGAALEKTDGDPIPIHTTGERLCRDCLRLCRRWGRDIYILVRPSGGLDQFVYLLFAGRLGDLYARTADALSHWDPDRAGDTPAPIDACVFCKLAGDDWDGDVDAHALGTGEQLCSTCLRDMRQFTRSLLVHILGHRDLPAAVKDDLRDLTVDITQTMDKFYPTDDAIYAHGFHAPTNASEAR